MIPQKNKWILAGFVATVVIILSVPIYLIKNKYFGNDKITLNEKPTFVGRETCIDCHKIQYDLWLGSDHDLAMDYANDSTVLGDFNNAELITGKKTHRFYKKNDKYYVYTSGIGDSMQEYEVKYTFGYHPLQQYLVEFPGGRLQTLSLTWDTISKSWYDMANAVYPDQNISHENWLHWTNQAQNWNGMCADCHSTNLQKNYNINTDTYQTTWSEIDVSCEACHGPASDHLIWADLPESKRPYNNNFGLVVKTSNINNFQYVDLCARCHSRRTALQDYKHDTVDLLNHMIPELIREPLYFPDGQIRDEVYVFGSFTQSRMYMEEVKCNDCHDVHSGKLLLEGNKLCLQCHREDVYESYNHHFHQYHGDSKLEVIDEFGIEQQVGSGTLCINCHMTGKYYMGVDYRRDHSFRIPRPDLSDKFNSPNACTQCHANQSNQWASNYLKQWYGESINPHYSIALAIGSTEDTMAFEQLKSLVDDELYPVLVRATALSILGEKYPIKSIPILKSKLKDLESLVRHTSLQYVQLNSQEDIESMVPLLNDPIKAVRFEAAKRLSYIPLNQLPQNAKALINTNLTDYKEAMEYSGDFAAGRHNLANYYWSQGNIKNAVGNFKSALSIDNSFFPAKVNLAVIYNQQGKNDSAILLLEEVLLNQPENEEIQYSLGLVLAETGQYKEAAKAFENAIALNSKNPRLFYNLALVWQRINENEKAEKVLLSGLKKFPGQFDLLFALSDHYIRTNNNTEARKYAEKITSLYPEKDIGWSLLKAIDNN